MVLSLSPRLYCGILKPDKYYHANDKGIEQDILNNRTNIQLVEQGGQFIGHRDYVKGFSRRFGTKNCSPQLNLLQQRSISFIIIIR
jgi:hypothetical protein